MAIQSKSRDIVVAPCEENSKKLVSFCPVVRYKAVKRLTDYTGDDFEKKWYSRSEINKILDECKETARKMVNGVILLAEDGYCKRGLEFLSNPEGFKSRSKNKAYAGEVVMEEQHLQRSMGIVDLEYLAEVYLEASKDSRCLAHVMGLRDEQETRPLLLSKSSIHLLREKRKLCFSSPMLSPASLVDAF